MLRRCGSYLDHTRSRVDVRALSERLLRWLMRADSDAECARVRAEESGHAKRRHGRQVAFTARARVSGRRGGARVTPTRHKSPSRALDSGARSCPELDGSATRGRSLMLTRSRSLAIRRSSATAELTRLSTTPGIPQKASCSRSQTRNGWRASISCCCLSCAWQGS